MQTILYARVSTSDQTAAHQRIHAEANGFVIDDVVVDEAVSGVTVPLRERTEGRRLFDKLRRGDVLVVRWVDRLGRNYEDVTDSIRQFMRMGVIVKTVINKMVFDGSTTDPTQQAVRDALIAFMAATAQAQAEATKEAQKAGIEYAKGKDGKYLGRRPTYTHAHVQTVQEMTGQAVGTIAKTTGLSRQAVYRIQADPAKAVASLLPWK
jgi:putative DNA-invertase from lambdoid prophage Rac